MAKLGDVFAEMQDHQVTFKNSRDEKIVSFSLLLTVILAIIMPQVLLVVAILVLLDILKVEYDGRLLTWHDPLPEEKQPDIAPEM